ncbi:hypothetical protein ABEB36_015362 [Hypothenemus hampei]|uniref:HAT C-terminal dimerisation domain-containing protein n=1 Tax=Hypothenemus hampei TaxID=57062 RepID=A0ABD1E201_HYPHA
MNNSNRNPKKIQGLSGTRWLARYEAICTILNQWEELKLLFFMSKNDDKCYMARQLYDIMNNVELKAFLVYLKYELRSVIQLNLVFQGDTTVEPTKVFDDLYSLYKNLLQKIVVPSQLEKVRDANLIEFDFIKYLMHSSSIYFGYDFHEITKNINPTTLSLMKETCKTFLVRLAEQIRLRLPENLETLKMISNLHPKIATSQVRPQLTNVIEKFQRNDVFGDKNFIESEWNQLQNIHWIKLDNSVDFYTEVSDNCDAAGHKRFANISKFAFSLLSIPLSNASVERAFSIYGNIKNKLRNRLSIENLQSIMMVRFNLQRNGSCTNFEPTQEMLNLFKVDMYDYKNSNVAKEVTEIINFIVMFD